MKNKLASLFFLIILFSCEEDIIVSLPEGDSPLVFDAWLYHLPDTQTISITRASTYFDTLQPSGVLGATVQMIDVEQPSEKYLFTHQNNGNYIWTPADPTDTFGTMDNNYVLMIEIAGIVYQSTTGIYPVPRIDSINWKLSDMFTDEDFYLASFWARDLVGTGNTYWIKSWKNDQLLNKPSEINIAYDAAFSDTGSENADGMFFIPPIREGINPFDTDEKGNAQSPFKLGDSIYVEINSISLEAFYFLEQVQIQTNRQGGFGELFAVPLTNIESNIDASNQEKVLGFFNISAVSGLRQQFTEERIRNE